jgi:NAD(P)-dependent dehydrogenase (short-subunit alcohol dehydrogenase family)
MSVTSSTGGKAVNPIYDFKGQVALVTGAAKGMGLATARMFAASGASVVLADLDGDLAANEAERIVGEGGQRNPHRLRCRRGGAGRSDG